VHFKEFSLLAGGFGCSCSGKGIRMDTNNRIMAESKSNFTGILFFKFLNNRKIRRTTWALEITVLN